ncbi:MAG: lysozyme inhibitor LprI family protein [Gammaproteobacteria bacterium]
MRKHIVGAFALFALAGCSNSVESMVEEYNANCFANSSTYCATLKIDIGIAKVQAFLDEIQEEETRGKLIAERGKAAYRELLLQARNQLFRLEIERPSWIARTFSSDRPYEYAHMSEGERAMMASRIESAQEDWQEIVAEVDAQLRDVADTFSGAQPAAAQVGNPAGESAGDVAATAGDAPVSQEAGDAGAPAVASPSFDCGKASTPAEQTICSDAELAALDVELSGLYRNLRESYPDPAALKSEQVAWVRNDRDGCADAACMKAAYRARIDDLAAAAQYLSKPAEFR